MIDHKGVHILLALAIIIFGFSLNYFIPDLYGNALLKFSTIGGLATFYSMLFAVVEVIRTKGVAEKARVEAVSASRGVERLYSIKDLSTCQSAVEMAMNALDKNEPIPSSVMCQITKIYSQVFHKELINTGSDHRIAKSMLDSYSFATTNTTKMQKNNKQQLRGALLKIMEHLSINIGQNTKVESTDDSKAA